ncbi:hypothetical protein D9V41_04845 [Aeromicrobium phragmitis]|uniref:PRC-barrel domain containing protein n=1 Tax=Aeromicrobium phragmitis TaxID=2478914 RepID=A0A3L8PM53_9ACTN|nr:hypothetical protein [Aeromicrobium phragmitis]RLV56415.1 hypothetical protein D9V41_04845 [Aeromicrobium phragmitis]
MPQSFDVVLTLANRQIVDADGTNHGKVDDLLLREDGDGLVVDAILAGFPAWSARLGGPLGSWMLRTWNLLTDTRPPDVVPFSEVERIDSAVHLQRGAKVPENLLERWLREHLVAKIPGAGHEG